MTLPIFDLSHCEHLNQTSSSSSSWPGFLPHLYSFIDWYYNNDNNKNMLFFSLSLSLLYRQIYLWYLFFFSRPFFHYRCTLTAKQFPGHRYRRDRSYIAMVKTDTFQWKYRSLWIVLEWHICKSGSSQVSIGFNNLWRNRKKHKITNIHNFLSHMHTLSLSIRRLFIPMSREQLWQSHGVLGI